MPKLTSAAAAKAAPAEKAYWMWDTVIPGLGLRVLPSGAKSYALRYRSEAGRSRQITLGSPDVLMAEAARDLARQHLADVSRGGDPMQARVQARTSPTVEALFEAHIAAMRAQRKGSAAEVERALLTGRYAAAATLGRTAPASSVTPADVSAVLARAYKRGSRVMADRLRAYLSAAFQFGASAAHDYTQAVRADWGIKSNPVTLVPRDQGALMPRERALAADEMAALWQGLSGKGFSPDMSDAIRLMMLCGQRVRETLRARGADFDGDVWRLPARTTKGGKPHSLPLPARALPIVAGLIERNGSGHLFPARGLDGHLSDGSVNRALARWQAESGAAHFQARDLRRTWKSRAGDAGVDRFTRDLIQQHAQASDTGSRHYDRADYIPQMREAMSRWSAWLDGVLDE